MATLSLAQNPRLVRNVEKFVAYEVNFEQTPGLIIGIIEGGETYFLGFGETEKGNNHPPDARTIFEIGTLTKVFTAALLQQLVQEGRVRYEQPLTDFFEKDQIHPSFASITLRNLATHTSQLPRTPTNFSELERNPNDPFAFYTDADFDAFLKNYEVLAVGNYTYSNVNFALLERVIERIEGEDLQRVLKRRILQPLGLNDTAYELTPAQQQDMATSYLLDGLPTSDGHFASFFGAVGLKSSAADLLEWLRLHLAEPTDSLTLALQAIQQFQCKTSLSKYIDMAIGWHLAKPKRRYFAVVSHRGTAAGHQAYVGFVKETQTGVVVLANSRNNLDGLGYYLLKMLNNNWRRKTP